MRHVFRKLVRGLLATAFSAAFSLTASAADESIFRFPSMLDDARSNQVASAPSVVRGQRSFKLVQFDDPNQVSPSDIRRSTKSPSKGSSTRKPMLEPEPDSETMPTDDDYMAEFYETCCEDLGTWMTNSELLFATDTYKSIGDADGSNSLNNSFGLRGGFNTGIGLGGSPVRLQIGGIYGAYDLKGRPDPAFDSSLEQQAHITFGLYKRSDICNGSRYSWGLVIDEFYAQRWGFLTQSIDLAQLRGQIGYALDEANEIGGWCAVSLDRESATTISSQGQLAQIQAMDQFNAFWHRNWSTGADTTLYAGMIENADLGDWVVGATGRAPLSSKTALYGGVTYVGSHSGTGVVGVQEEAWNVSFGVLFYPGCKAFNQNVSGQRGMPLIPVANTGTFLITP